MKLIKRLFLYALVLSLCTAPVLAGYNHYGYGSYSQRDPHLIFSFDAKHQTVRDQISLTALSQTYIPTNRNRTNSAGNLEAVAANTPVIDHVGASLTPALRVEPVAANILLGTPPTTQDLTLGTGAFTLQVKGAGTAVSSAGTATITGAGTASDGTPNTFTVTVAGTVTITISTATVVWLCPGSTPSSYFAGAAAITNIYTSNFSAGVNDWTPGTTGTVTGNIDGIGGENDWLRFTINSNNSEHYSLRGLLTFIPGNYYRIRYKYFMPSANSHIDQFRMNIGGINLPTNTTKDATTAIDCFFNATSAGTIIGYMLDGGAAVFQDAGADDVFYIKDVIIDQYGTVRATEAGSAAPTMAFDAAQTAALSGATGQGAIVWIPGASKAALSANHNIFAWNTGATNGIYLGSAAGAITISDGTNTATTAYSYVANTPCVITWYWAGGKIKIGAFTVGAASVTWGSEANYDGSFNPGANAIFGAGTSLQMPNRYQKVNLWNARQSDAKILTLN